MKKKLLVVISIFLMIVCMPLRVFAAEEYHVTDTVSFYDCWQKAITSKGSRIVLDRDITIEWNGYVLEDDAQITIDLNGHSIKGTGTNAEYIFAVDDEASLTIDDSSASKTGYIKIDKKEAKYKAVVCVDDDEAKLTLNNATLYGNDDPKTRVVIVNDGAFTINSGAIRDNIYEGWGSGVFIDEGSFYMNGGEICYNTANNQGDYNGCGGGIYYDGGSSTKFIMTGGEIHHNTAKTGGGIYFEDGGKYTTFGSGEAKLSGGRIHHNEATSGGGIFMTDESDGVELTGNLVIDYNRASGKDNGGGVYVHRQDAFLSDCTAILGGSVRIVDNYSSDLYSDPRYDAIEIDPKINTSPDKHAWVGLYALEKYYPMAREQDYYDYEFNENENDRNYSVCFFGLDYRDRNAQTVLVYDDNFILTHMTKTMRGVNVNLEKIVGKDGNRLAYGSYTGADYQVEMHDDLYFEYKIISNKGMILDESSKLLYSNRPECKSITLQKVNDKYVQKIHDDTNKLTRYTLYYLVKNEKTENDKTYYQDYYETVLIEVDDHKVSFDLNGHGEEEIPSKLVYDWETAVEPEEPEDLTYSFQGWFVDEECTERYDFSEPVTEDMVLYAGWATIGPPPLLCAVNFDMNGHGTQVDPSLVGVAYSFPLGEENKPVDPSCTGYTFTGWYKEAECINEWNFTEDKVYEDMALYAGWIEEIPDPGENIYTVNFAMNGHGNQIAYQTVSEGSTATKPQPDPEAVGYTFAGWYTDKECTNEFDFATPITQDTTLYAKWTSTVDVTFVGNYSGSAYEEIITETYSYGAKYTLPATNPTREGYGFVGWFTEPSFGEQVTTDTTIISSEAHTIYAQWKMTKEATCNPPLAVEDLEYTGAELKIAYDGNTKDGTMYYAVTDSEMNPEAISVGNWKTTIDTKIDSGTYYVYYRVVGDDYHTDTKIEEIEHIVTKINKSEPIFVAPKPIHDQICNGNPLTIAVDGNTSDGTMYYAVTNNDTDPIADGDWKTTIDKKTDVGTYFVHYYVKGDSNHTDTVPRTFGVMILPDEYFEVKFNMNGHGVQIADLNVKAGSKIVKPADPSESKCIFEGWYLEEDCINKWDFSNDTVTENPTILYAGWKENKAKVDVMPSAINEDYNGSPKKLLNTAGTAEGGTIQHLVSSSKETPDYNDSRWSNVIPQETNAGEYYVYYFVKGDDTHTDSEIGFVKAVINKIDLINFTKPVIKENLKYNGENQVLISEGATDEGTFYYALSKSKETPSEVWSNDLPEAKDPGTYYVHYFIKGDANHKDSEVFCTEEIQIEKVFFKVTFKTNSASIIEPLTVESGKTVVKPNNPSKDGYAFGGWYLEESLENEWNFDNDIVTKDISLFAKWIERHPYTPPPTGVNK